MLRRAVALSLEGHKEEPCFETGLRKKYLRKSKKQKELMLTCWISDTEEDTLAEEDDFEEEEMLKRAIAMSLEEH